MTACAIETTTGDGSGSGSPAVGPGAFTITANGAYAARLAGSGDALYVERWTLDGPEPYAVPLPVAQPEEPGALLTPLADGRVLVGRAVDGSRYAFSLLYPTGPDTGELSLGSVQAPAPGALTLLPPSPDGICAYAMCVGPDTTTLWLVAGGAFGPERVAEIRGRCSGGVWLDRTGRMLALDRQLDGGPVKAVAVDLERGGEVTPLLQITEESHDRLLLADPDSGLLLIRSDAPSPGHDRLGWGVLGSLLPVRFPECLRLDDAAVTPMAVQPGQVLMPENCGVALRIDAMAGSWVGMWRPSSRRMHHLAAPVGWLAGSALWTADGVLHLPYATAGAPCGLAPLTEPAETTAEAGAEAGTGAGAEAGSGATAAAATAGTRTPELTSPTTRTGAEAGAPEPKVCRPVPLQQAPLTNRKTAG
ncbi:hypothetical protein [Streptomyces roseicoloratus]|uniref:hypothetical protein n=1 Tax=Streptomyces roseicoloratus TaxID=2508722 RepID=UPI001009E63C|nr:hypothetical protein [Streptomyces roseicoloratus]